MCRFVLVGVILAAASCLSGQQVLIGSPDPVPANTGAQGQLDYIVFGFGAQKTATAAASVALTSVTLQNLGNALPADWVRIRLIKDVNTNGMVDVGPDIVLSSVLSTNFPVTFPPLPPGDTIPLQPAASVYLVAVDITAGATLGRTFNLQLAANTDFVTGPSQVVFGAPIAGTVQTIGAPSTAEMDVQRVAATSIARGSTDNVGNRAVGVALQLSWTVLNTGTQTLTLQGAPQVYLPTFARVNCTPSLFTPPAATVSASGQTTFTLQFTVAALGPFGFLVWICNNDANENAYSFVVSGTGANPPEMDVTRAAAPVADGATDTVTGAIAGAATVLTYTISNTGTGALTLGVPVAAPGMQSNCTALITTQPAASVNAAGATTLVVSVTPAAGGAFAFTLSISNDDANENPYNWTVSGNAAGPEMDVFRGGTMTAVPSGGNDARGTLNGGMSHPLAYDIRNTGLAVLSLPSGVSISMQNNCTATGNPLATTVAAAGVAVLTLNVTPGVNGPFSFNVSIASNDANENPYTWTVSGTSFVPQPEMDVLRGAVPVASAANDLVGTVASFVQLNLVYTVENTGTAALDLNGAPDPVVVTPGVNVTAAAVGTQPSNSVAPTGATSFTVIYTVGGAGPFSMSVSIANNDANENPYAFTISGTGLPGVPEIELTRAGAPVADGGTDTLPGPAVPGNTAFSLIYTIGNVGTGALTITPPVTITGQVGCAVTVLTQPGSTVAASGTTSLVIEVTPSGGAFSFNISVDNSDANENPYDWVVAGTALIPMGPSSSATSSSGCKAGPAGPWSLLAVGFTLMLGCVRRVQRRTGQKRPPCQPNTAA